MFVGTFASLGFALTITALIALVWLATFVGIRWQSPSARDSRRFLSVWSSIFFLTPIICVWGLYAWRATAYQVGLTRFEEICRTQAELKIFRTVPNVEGLVVARLRTREGAQQRSNKNVESLADQYGLEDPYGYDSWEADDPQEYFLLHYAYFEVPENTSKSRVTRWERVKSGRTIQYRDTEKESFRSVETYEIRKDTAQAMRGRFAYEWRDIPIENGRENWIAGSETTIRDVTTNEILARRRGFVFAQDLRVAAPWGMARHMPRRACPEVPLSDTVSLNINFVQRVLLPAQPKLVAPMLEKKSPT